MPHVQLSGPAGDPGRCRPKNGEISVQFLRVEIRLVDGRFFRIEFDSPEEMESFADEMGFQASEERKERFGNRTEDR